MAKIPKNLSDKDMIKGFQEEPTLEEMFLAKETPAEKQRQSVRQEAQNIELAYLTPDVVEKLGKLLLELKVVLYQDGVKDYQMSVRRDGHDIILSPVEAKNRKK